MYGSAAASSASCASIPPAPAVGAEPSEVAADEKAGDGEGDTSSSDDDMGVVSGGFMSTLKTFAPADKQPGPKASAKAVAKAVPKAKVAPKASAARLPKVQSVKVNVGNAGKRRKIVEDMSSGGGVMDPGMSGELSEPDVQLLDEFKERLQNLKTLDPPTADGPFKSYLNDISSSTATVKADIKTKRRSAMRRADKDLDPLYIALGELLNDADNFTHLLKCFVDFLGMFCLSCKLRIGAVMSADICKLLCIVDSLTYVTVTHQQHKTI